MIDGVKRAEVLLFYHPHLHSTPILGSEGHRGSEASPHLIPHKNVRTPQKMHEWSNKMNMGKVVLNKAKLVQKMYRSAESG